VKLDGDKLKQCMADAGASVEDLAGAVAREGLRDERAASAVRNWMSGRDKPRAKPEDIRTLADALGRRPVELVRFVSIARFTRSSPRKARLLADLIRGRRVDEAMTLLQFNHRRASEMVQKALQAAIADAEQAEADIAHLVVSESRVDGGPIIKRFRPKDRGRAHPINKRTSHIVVGVEEAA